VEVVWHRADLRVHDHAALAAARAAGSVVGLVVLDPAILDHTSLRRRAWFFANVRALREEYARRGGQLFVRQGAPWDVIPRFGDEVGARRVHAIRNYTPYARTRDEQVRDALPLPIVGHPGHYVHDPGAIRRDDRGTYSVYTPFAKQWTRAGLPAPVDEPGDLATPSLDVPPGDIPEIASDVPLPPAGEEAALHALDEFVNLRLPGYAEARNRLDGSGGSRLSIYLNIGVLSPRAAARRVSAEGGKGAAKWLGELAWRDFLAELLWQRPRLTSEPFDPRWERFQWNEDPEAFEAWLHGRTGIPVVDAAMRELHATGFISNRARMIVAQCATKLMMLPWWKCEPAFRQLLLDGDTAQNVGSWQWSAGVGVDAAPYFRVFNPVAQGEEHDPDGTWVSRWVPESNGRHDLLAGARVDPSTARKRYLELAGQLLRPRQART
jgi:deoxyribodipyrimidine photo-lyase